MDTTETKFKMCFLCSGENIGGMAHKKDSVFKDYHYTNGNLWQPTKGHKDYETHKKWITLLN